MARAALLLFVAPLSLIACAAKSEGRGSGSEVGAEPLDLPADPAENGVPVGVQTVELDGVTIEVWYPASDSAAGDPTESADFMDFVPDSVIEVLGPFGFPLIETGAVRDAPLRVPEAPYPIITFSHGFGGARLQSVDFAVHLASRGYVVVAADHPGRMMTDILPCMFSPALEGCDLSGFGSDPAVEDIAILTDWITGPASTDSWLAGAIDPEHMGLSGHSAGGGSTLTVGELDPRYDALLPMAAPGAVERDVPTLLLGGTCDSFASDAAEIAAGESMGAGSLVRVQGAGHLAFSDLCELDMLGLAEDLLIGREDINESLLASLIQLGSDGCEGAPSSVEGCAEGYLPLETSDPIVRYYSTVFFDQTLRGEGIGVTGGVFAEAELR